MAWTSPLGLCLLLLGKPFSSEALKGGWSLLYFGFTFCPDICPEELDKLAEALEIVDTTDGAPSVTPVFVTIDPDRDTPEKLGPCVTVIFSLHASLQISPALLHRRKAQVFVLTLQKVSLCPSCREY